MTGTVREDKRAKGGYELTASASKSSAPAHDYPITPKEHGVDYLLDRRHLWIRAERQTAILRVRHEVINAVRDFFNSQGFILADTPIFTPAACEGTTTLFPVQYFEDTTAYLTQSGQLYNEANAMALGKGVLLRSDLPRGEKQDAAPSDRVLDGRARDGLCRSQRCHRACRGAHRLGRRARARQASGSELKVLERDTSKLEAVKAPFPRLHYDEAAKILHDKGVPFEVGSDLGGTDETVLSEQFDRPVCVTHYPAAVKAFYMKPDPAQPDRALCVDVLAPEGYGEIIGGGQRLDDYDLLIQRIKEHNLPPEAFEWYLDLRRFGTRAARRLRHGYRARRHLDLRPRACPRGDPVSADAVQAVSMTVASCQFQFKGLT